jgi:hypothetical protein
MSMPIQVRVQTVREKGMPQRVGGRETLLWVEGQAALKEVDEVVELSALHVGHPG